jgi:hypothetical protein
MYDQMISKFYRTLWDITSQAMPSGVVVLWVQGYGGKEFSGYRLLICKEEMAGSKKELVPYFLQRVPPPEMRPYSERLIRLSATKVYPSSSWLWVEEAPAVAKRTIAFATLISEGKGKRIASFSVVNKEGSMFIRDHNGCIAKAQVFAPPSEEAIKRLVAFRKERQESMVAQTAKKIALERELFEAKTTLAKLMIPVSNTRSQIARTQDAIDYLQTEIAESDKAMRDARPLFDMLH